MNSVRILLKDGGLQLLVEKMDHMIVENRDRALQVHSFKLT